MSDACMVVSGSSACSWRKEPRNEKAGKKDKKNKGQKNKNPDVISANPHNKKIDRMAATGSRALWWQGHEKLLIELCQKHESCYVYDSETIQQATERLKTLPASRFFFAIKANPHASILRLLEASGLGFECVSVGELRYVQGLFPGLDSKRILFTPNFAPRVEYQTALKDGVWLTLDSMHALRRWAADFANAEVFLRIDTGNPDGHHDKVRTAGPKAKFGIALWDIDEAKQIAEAHGIRIVGLHAHVGSGIRRHETWYEVAQLLGRLCASFPLLRYLDVGGGLGIVEHLQDQQQADLDMIQVASGLQRFLDTPESKRPDGSGQPLELWVEPGRYLVAEAGILLSQVTQLKDKGTKKFVGISTGFNSLIRPTLYSAWHEIINLSRWPQSDDPQQSYVVDVVGPICETGDILGVDRCLPKDTDEGDVILIATAGAYGHSMSSFYNMREPATEVFLQRGWQSTPSLL